jgi:MFS family permease
LIGGRKPRRNGPLFAIVSEGFFSRLSFGVISFALPLFAFRLGLGLGEIGILVGFNLMVAMVLKVPMGWLADRVGLKRFLVVAIGLRSVVSLLFVFAGTPWQLFVVRGVHGLSIAMRDPAANALIAELGGKKKVASSFAWYQTSKSLAGSFGRGLGGILLGLTAANFRLAFLASFVLSAMPIYVVVRHVRDRGRESAHRAGLAPESADATSEAPRAPEGEVGRFTSPERESSARRSALPFLLLGLLVSGTAYMMSNLFPILAVEYAGLSEAQTGLIFMLTPLAIFMGPAFGWLSDRVGHHLVLALRSAANVVSSVLYWVAPTLAGYAAARLVDDAGKAAFKPAWGSLMAHVAAFDRRNRARTMGLLSVGEDAGEVLGPILAGFLWSTWGVGILFAGRIVLALVTEAYAAILGRAAGPGRGRMPGRRLARRSGAAPRHPRSEHDRRDPVATP